MWSRFYGGMNRIQDVIWPGVRIWLLPTQSAFHVMQQQFNIKALQCIETLHKVYRWLHALHRQISVDIDNYKFPIGASNGEILHTHEAFKFR